MLDANATRIQYYATVGAPLCDLNFVKSGLGFCDVATGNGVQAPGGELINVHYTARFADGTVFDSSYKRGRRPLTMRIGVGKVLPGLDQGILGGGGVPPMHVEKESFLYLPNWHMDLNQQDAFQVIATFLPTLLCFMTFSLLEFTNKLDELGNYSEWMNKRTRQINKGRSKVGSVIKDLSHHNWRVQSLTVTMN